jgi:hypothetical protein
VPQPSANYPCIGKSSRSESDSIEQIRIALSTFLARPAPTTRFGYVYDGHGSVRAPTGSTGAVTDTYDFRASGKLTLTRFVKFG